MAGNQPGARTSLQDARAARLFAQAYEISCGDGIHAIVFTDKVKGNRHGLFDDG